jgi:hypothetical protein
MEMKRLLALAVLAVSVGTRIVVGRSFECMWTTFPAGTKFDFVFQLSH